MIVVLFWDPTVETMLLFLLFIERQTSELGLLR